jgi:hypothetical protein
MLDMFSESANDLIFACIAMFIMINYCFRTKLHLLCQCGPVQQFVRRVDYLFYQNIVELLIPDVLSSIPRE